MVAGEKYAMTIEFTSSSGGVVTKTISYTIEADAGYMGEACGGVDAGLAECAVDDA